MPPFRAAAARFIRAINTRRRAPLTFTRHTPTPPDYVFAFITILIFVLFSLLLMPLRYFFFRYAFFTIICRRHAFAI